MSEKRAECGIEQDAVERCAKAGPGKQDEGEERQHGELEVGQLDGEEEDESGGGEQPPEGDVDGLLVGEIAVLIRSECGDDGGEKRDGPKRRVKNQSEDSGDEDDGGEDAFHAVMRISRSAGGSAISNEGPSHYSYVLTR